MAPNGFPAFPAIASVTAKLDSRLYPGFFAKIDFVDGAYVATLGHESCSETQFMFRDETLNISAVLCAVDTAAKESTIMLAKKMVLMDNLPKNLEYLLAE